MTSRRHLPSELVIGVVGPYDLVERIMLSGAAARDEAFGAIPSTSPPGQRRTAETGSGETGGIGLAGRSGGSGGSGAPGGPGERGVALSSPGPAPPREEPEGLIGSALPRRLIAAAYRREREAPEKVARLGAGIDVCLFASPVPYEYARRAGMIAVPATYVRLDGGALYAALLRASRDRGYDIERISVDVLSRAAVEEAYAELGIVADSVRLREDPASPAALAAFHERLWRMGETSVALTCLDSVARRLERAGVPVITVRPTDGAIRMAVWNAVLLGGHHRLEAAQFALVVVEVPRLREGARRSLSRHSRDELRLTVHRFLVQEAQRVQAMVSQADDHSFVIVATRGSLAAATGDFAEVPFEERARSELGVTIEVGIGMGRTAQEAEAHARSALARSRSAGTPPAVARREGHPLVPAPRRAAGPHARPVPSRGIETLTRLADRLEGADTALVVDAETAGRLLGVTSRTARRLLRGLVDEGLAWPLPPSRAAQPGRPRQFYRLITEKLDDLEPSRAP
ncbi:MAG TPA: transcriptional regulator [Streptosporangiaceae bacterium]|nr:transcriptional regulator [Streptosporangiaceae bacterium]